MVNGDVLIIFMMFMFYTSMPFVYIYENIYPITIQTILGIYGLVITLYAIGVENNNHYEHHRYDNETYYGKKYDYPFAIEHRKRYPDIINHPYSRAIKMIFNLQDNNIFNLQNRYYNLIFYIYVILDIYPTEFIPYKEILMICCCMFHICISLITNEHFRNTEIFLCIFICIIIDFAIICSNIISIIDM